MMQHWTRDRHGEVVPWNPRRPSPRIPEMMTYPFPLHGCIARFILPVDLTAAEAARIGRMVRTLAIDTDVEQLVRESA